MQNKTFANNMFSWRTSLAVSVNIFVKFPQNCPYSMKIRFMGIPKL